jgi:hypothetical protein
MDAGLVGWTRWMDGWLFDCMGGSEQGWVGEKIVQKVDGWILVVFWVNRTIHQSL